MRFYKNLEDDLHCFQAALLIVLSHYFPKKEYSFKYIDKVTGFKKGFYTQDTKGLLWLRAQGFEFVRISDFNEQLFIRDGEKYLKWYWRPEIYERQKRTTDFKEMRSLSKKLASSTRFVTRLPTAKDIQGLLDEGYTVIAHVNPNILLRRKNRQIANHSVVVLSGTRQFFTIHNPGLPPEANKRVSKKLLQKAAFEAVGIRPCAKGK